jgi:hypothetical protein
MQSGAHARPQIGGLEIENWLGRGPRAEVWRARTRQGQQLVVKIFLPELCRHPQFLTSFERYTASLLSLSHPNIVTPLDRGKSGSQYYVVSPWVSGGSLRSQGLASKASPKHAIEIALEVCDALDYAHRRGLLHRNLVLDNILIDDRDRVRVSDFSLSLLHTPQTNEYDARSDLQGLGRIVTELMSPSARRAVDSSARLEDVLARALSADPAQRFSRATEMALALRLAMPGEQSAVREKHEISGEFAFTTSGKVILVTVGAHATSANAAQSIDALAIILDRPGPWRIAYDMGAVATLDEGLNALLRRLHVRNQANLKMVAFSSPRASVRASALRIAGAVSDVRWRMFSTSALMHQWVEQEMSP